MPIEHECLIKVGCLIKVECLVNDEHHDEHHDEHRDEHHDVMIINYKKHRLETVDNLVAEIIQKLPWRLFS